MLDKIYYRIVRKLITRKDEHNQYSGGLWPRLVREAAAGLCQSETGRIIELGCGEGLFLAKVAQDNPRADIYGVDLSEDLLDQAKARLTGHLNIHLSQGTALKTDFAGEYFNYCFCVNVVINLPQQSDIEKLFSEVYRVLKPGGSFVFDIRNSLSPIIQLQYRLARFYDTGLTVPLRSYNRLAIEKLLKKQGFTIISRTPLGFPKNIFAPAVIFHVKKP
jgi:ubiquinone/menaquinone biosynthesis C-methylase UbiE